MEQLNPLVGLLIIMGLAMVTGYLPAFIWLTGLNVYARTKGVEKQFGFWDKLFLSFGGVGLPWFGVYMIGRELHRETVDDINGQAARLKLKPNRFWHAVAAAIWGTGRLMDKTGVTAVALTFSRKRLRVWQKAMSTDDDPGYWEYVKKNYRKLDAFERRAISEEIVDIKWQIEKWHRRIRYLEKRLGK